MLHAVWGHKDMFSHGHIGLGHGLLRQLNACILIHRKVHLSLQLCRELLAISAEEAACALLVHFCLGRHSIHGHHEQPAWPVQIVLFIKRYKLER